LGILLPDWALKFNYFAESPSQAHNPDCKVFWEKCFARPQGIKNRLGLPPNGGQWAETYAKNRLIEGMPDGEAFHHANASLDEYDPLPWKEKDAELYHLIRTEEYKDEEGHTATLFKHILEHLYEGLRVATEGSKNIRDGRKCSVQLEGCELDWVGELDVEDGGVVELKTQWPSIKSKTKSEKEKRWGVNSLPPKPKEDHLAQCAIYKKWLGDVPVKIIYANVKGYRIFTSNDCDELKPDSLEQVLEDLKEVALRREDILRDATDHNHLLRLVPHQIYEHWRWKGDAPEYIDAALAQWEAAYE